MTTTRTHWLNRAPAMLKEAGLCSVGHDDPTSVDRRWLWRLETVLAVDAPMSSRLDEIRADLAQYLYETCEHHWHEYAAENGIPAHRQCTWCHDVEWVEQPDGVEVGAR